MKPTNIHDAKTHFSKLLDRVAAGEEVVIARAGKPVARLVKYTEPSGRRHGGQWKGLVRISEDFDAPLPDDLAAAFRGGDRHVKGAHVGIEWGAPGSDDTALKWGLP